jgi:chromosome segregation ATPase
MSDSSDQQAAMEPLRAPAGRDVVERVTAERLAPPRLRAVDADRQGDSDRVAGLEDQVTEERAARKKAEAAANEMAVLIARVRAELAEAREARETADATAGQMAELIAKEHERTRKLEDELRLAWAQVPMVEQAELDPGRKPRMAKRAKRALGR